MIDFGKTTKVPKGVSVTHRSKWVQGNREDGFLLGLDSLISCWGALSVDHEAATLLLQAIRQGEVDQAKMLLHADTTDVLLDMCGPRGSPPLLIAGTRPCHGTHPISTSVISSK